MIQSFLRIFFKHLYTTIAWAYDWVAFTSSMGQWRTWQHVVLDPVPEGRILEIGHGTGHVLKTLFANKLDAFGIDLSKQMTRITARRLRSGGYPNNICRAKAQSLPFPSDSFQCLLATFPSDYIFDEDTFREAWRVLKLGGDFIIIPGVSSITGWKDVKTPLSLFDQISMLLYDLTGESLGIEKDWQNRFKDRMGRLGFKVDIEFVEKDRATVIKITAIKQPQGKTNPR
jgi:ubiquinone/menaquinone biosynthesis C-methylase UbiE